MKTALNVKCVSSSMFISHKSQIYHISDERRSNMSYRYFPGCIKNINIGEKSNECEKIPKDNAFKACLVPGATRFQTYHT